MDFEYRENADGSFALYNTKIEDIYFSNIGAHREAMEKFVIPSFPINKKKVKILDVCYGMGYNSKSFCNYVINSNINLEIEIDAIDIDKNILALGLFIFDKNISDDLHYFFGFNLLNQIDLTNNIENLSKETWIKDILSKNMPHFSQNKNKFDIFLYKQDKISTFLHNIYYQNQGNIEKYFQNLKINYFLGNVLDILPNLSSKYDLIFHDAFSILKQPELWSEDILNNYFRLLNNTGKLLTYSNSRIMKKRLLNIGYEVISNYNSENKLNGTIGFKK